MLLTSTSALGISWPLFAVICGVAVALAVFLVVLIRRRLLREKYIALWLVVGVATLGLGFPPVATMLARGLGVAVPANLVFFGAIVLLLAISIHLSLECSALEEKVRVLAEESALLAVQVQELSDVVRPSQSESPPS